MRRLGLAVAVLCGAIFALTFLVAASARLDAAGKFGGVLTVDDGSGPITLDPTLNRLSNGNEIFSAICEGLYRTNATNEVVPDLATALPTISPDKLTYTVNLRQGIQFNDGTPFNAQAVVETFQRDMTLPGSAQLAALAFVGSVTATGPTRSPSI